MIVAKKWGEEVRARNDAMAQPLHPVFQTDIVHKMERLIANFLFHLSLRRRWKGERGGLVI